MALPKLAKEVIDNVEQSEKEEAREKALEKSAGGSRRKPAKLTAEQIRAAAKAELRAELAAELAAENAANEAHEPEPEPELTEAEIKAAAKAELRAELAAELAAENAGDEAHEPEPEPVKEKQVVVEEKQVVVEEKQVVVEEKDVEQVEQQQLEVEQANKELTVNTSGTKLPATSEDLQIMNPMQALIDMGLAEASGDMALNLDFTSFPMVVLDKGKFKTSEDALGQDFEYIFLNKRKTFLYRGNIGDRDAEPELLYSNDKVSATMGDKTVAQVTAEWEAKGWEWEIKDYYLLMGTIVGGDLQGEIVQLSLPQSSIGRWDGYMMAVACQGKNPTEVVTKVMVGKEVGSGTKVFNPWRFKLVS